MVDPLIPDAPARVLLPARARIRVVPGAARILARPSIPVVYPQGHDDRLLIVEAVTERRLAEVRGASVEKPSWVLNGVGSLDFTCSAWDDAMDQLVTPDTVVDGAGVMRLIGREVQFWRDGVLRWAGPPITGNPVMDGTVSFACKDLGWHIYRKFFGAAERRDQLHGIGSMDVSGLPGWTLAGSASKARDTVDKARGAGSMVLSGNGAVTASFSLPARPIAPPVHLTAMAKIPAGTSTGTGIMTIAVYTSTGELVDQASAVVDESTEFGGWQRFSTYAGSRNGVDLTVTVTLWSPGDHGATKFDDVRALENNTTGSPVGGDDLVRHIESGLRHVQSGEGQGPGFGFGFRIIDFTGKVEVLGERHLNHAQFSDFLSRYTSREDGLDWKIDPLTREMVVGPRIGVDHQHVTLHDRSVQAGGWTHDESKIAAKVVVPGDSDGNGVDRPEGGYLDASNTAGLVYDEFFQPPDGTPLSALDPMAKQRHATVSQPQVSLDSMAVSDDLLGIVNPGDTVPSTLRIGKFRLPGNRVRIGEVALDIEAGQLELV